MPQTILLTGTVSTTARPETPAVAGVVTVENAGGPSPVEWNITRLSTALAASRAPFRRLGLQLNLGAGGYDAIIPNTDIAADLTISESLDSYSDELRFSIIGEKYSPLTTALLRGKADVSLFIVYGAPGSEYWTLLFSGVVITASYSATRRTTDIVALDDGARYADSLVSIDIPPGSGRTRLSVVYELLASVAGGVPIASIDIGGEGGTLQKPVSYSDQRVFDFLRDFLSPLDAGLWFEQGLLVVRRFNPAEPSTRALEMRDIAAPLTIDTPSASNPNVITVVSVRSDTLATTGLRTDIQTETTRALYAIKRATEVQTGSGTTAPGAPPEAPTERIISKVITTTTYLGDIALRTEVEEWGWYAPQAGRLQINIDESITPLFGVQRYLFPDGSWRSAFEETFRIIRKTITTRVPDERARVVRQVEDRYFYHFIEEAPYEIAPDGTELVSQVTPITESGQGVLYGQEVIGLFGESGAPPSTLYAGLPDSQTVTVWDLADDGSIKSVIETVYDYSTGSDRSRTQPGSHGYGTGTVKQYKSLSLSTNSAGQTVRTTRYTQLSEDAYAIDEVTTVFLGGSADTGSVRKNSTAAGSVPYPQRVGSSAQTQEMRTTLTDRVRLALSGRIEESIHNEFCENESELRTVALARARELAALTFRFDMPLEGQIHKGRWLTLPVSERATLAGERLRVVSVERNFARYRQTVEARYYPPEVLA